MKEYLRMCLYQLQLAQKESKIKKWKFHERIDFFKVLTKIFMLAGHLWSLKWVFAKIPPSVIILEKNYGLPTVRGCHLHWVGETVSVSCHLCWERGDFLAEIRCKWQLFVFHHAFSDLIRIFGFSSCFFQIYSEF